MGRLVTVPGASRRSIPCGEKEKGTPVPPGPTKEHGRWCAPALRHFGARRARIRNADVFRGSCFWIPGSLADARARNDGEISALHPGNPPYISPAHHSRGRSASAPTTGPVKAIRWPITGSQPSAADQPEKTMPIPDFSMRQLLEAGVHFGHQAHRWNPKMGQYIFGTRNNIHIVDLAQTVPMLHRALQAVSDTVAKGGRILFVGTKRQAQDSIADAAKRSAQYYVNSRWLGGTLTNWKTISGSISRLRKLEEMLSSGESGGYTKKERLTMQRERDKLDRSLGGIKDMGGIPDLIFVIDTNKEDIAIKEARRLNVPVAAVV